MSSLLLVTSRLEMVEVMVIGRMAGGVETS